MPEAPAPVRLVLASASPARLATLKAAGIEPSVMVSSINEDELLTQAQAGQPNLDPKQQVELLARAKAEDVARHCGPALVLGCDSMLELDGEVLGKPTGPEDACRRIRQQAGRAATLHTGHHLIDARGPEARQTGGTASAIVRFGQMTDQEIKAYVATGEPLNVAGAFTIDALGGPFIDGVDGDPHAVVGLSLPLLRTLLDGLGLSILQLWRPGLL
ncbi:MAG: Maf family nucleotide pyrophosphatase [Micrococcales bacterium]|nr:Maf family nucleotide pyrophosphatase [Micrococcales bacterium]